MSNVPKLRFKEFSGAWEDKLLNQVAEINPRAKKLPDEFIYIDLESVEKGLLVKKHKVFKADAPSRAQRLLDNQDILFQTVRPYQKNNYYFELGANYVASTGYAQIRANESSAFLYQKLHTDKFVNKVLLRCTGTSYPAINSTDLSKIKISLPSKQEQEKIASFLTSVDTKIEQLTKKEELLGQYKKGVMQKIFNQEVRFKADDGSEFPEWEEKTLGDIVVFKNGKAHEQDIDENGSYIVVNSKFISSDGEVKKYANSQIEPLCKNDIVMVMSDVPNGKALAKCYVIEDDEKYTLNQRICALQQKNDNNKFLYYVVNRNKYYLSFDSGVGQTNLRKDEVLNLTVQLPCIEEQNKIANFLSSIDTKIKQVQNQLKQTKEFKKALLQQMFV
jgi:type I restriction enzyme S subunit